MTRKSKIKPTAGGLPKSDAAPKGLLGSQTLLRGLDVLEAVASGATTLSALTDLLELNRSTAHRLAASLVERRYARSGGRSA